MSETPPAAPPGAPPVGASIEPSSRGHSFTERLLGALQLDPEIYGEVEHDQEALPQALGVVALAALCAGIGGVGAGSGALMAGVLGAVLGWLVSAAVVWLVGVRMLDHTSSYQELLRTIGFAQAPQLLLVLAAIPVLGGLLRIAVFVWGLAAYVVAVREALDVETGRAVLVCILAWGMALLLGFLMVALFGSCAAAG
jgi:hypothetical protein